MPLFFSSCNSFTIVQKSLNRRFGNAAFFRVFSLSCTLRKAALPKRRLRLFWTASIVQFSNQHWVTTLCREFNLHFTSSFTVYLVKVSYWSRNFDRNVLPVSIKWSLFRPTFVVFVGVDHSASELIEPFQRFIESSALGEFTSRVQLLFTFYKEMCNEEGRTSTLEGKLWPVNKTPWVTASPSW